MPPPFPQPHPHPHLCLTPRTATTSSASISCPRPLIPLPLSSHRPSPHAQFDINWDSLEPALDRFAQCFVAPLISADGVEREVWSAVRSRERRGGRGGTRPAGRALGVNEDAWARTLTHLAMQSRRTACRSGVSNASTVSSCSAKCLEPAQQNAWNLLSDMRNRCPPPVHARASAALA
eukprot:366570-Chlamydomonas_euryale.AAC.8